MPMNRSAYKEPWLLTHALGLQFWWIRHLVLYTINFLATSFEDFVGVYNLRLRDKLKKFDCRGEINSKTNCQKITLYCFWSLLSAYKQWYGTTRSIWCWTDRGSKVFSTQIGRTPMRWQIKVHTIVASPPLKIWSLDTKCCYWCYGLYKTDGENTRPMVSNGTYTTNW